MWTREYDTSAAVAVSGRLTPGEAIPAPVANANADAAWPDGNDVERGIATRRAIGTLWTRRSGRRLRESGLTSRLTIAEVTAIDAKPLIAARRPLGPSATANPAALPIHSFE